MDAPEINPADDATAPDPDRYRPSAVARARGLLEEMPARIGRYRILERIGGGGMGEVYVAEQTEPIKRRVAVKVIKAGMDTKQVVARFEAERQALAMMDHPNIARVFDAGATDTGRPYFVMELVRGVPITRFCDDNRLTTRQRVELLVPVCQAVQHAHQKGIIHRDIKPHNVLVTLHDGKPVPKVIDFGIAKATSQPLTDKTVYTEFRAMIGTPAYMSPEQAEMSGLDIDTRSDIYSLGVLAYELLTGAPPFDSDRLVKAGLGEIQRIIREEEPPRPSMRFSTLGASLTAIASHRGTEPARLSKLIAGELDWIVMRAMEKDRRRRYDTATDLAADFNRHLTGEPVLAAPPTWAYRTQKFLRKNKAAVITAAAVTAALAVGLGLTALQARRASKAEREADTQRDQVLAETEAVNKSLEELIYHTFYESLDRGRSTFDAFPIPNTGYSIGFYYTGKVHKVGVFRGDPFSVNAEMFNQPQPALPPGVLLKGLAVAVGESASVLEYHKNEAELEAYTADLAATQLAIEAENWPEARARVDACPASLRGLEWNFLSKRAHMVKFAIPSGYDRLSPDGTRIISRHQYGNLPSQLWDAVTGVPIGGRIKNPTSAKDRGHTFSPDGRLLHIISDDGLNQLWDTSTSKPVGATTWTAPNFMLPDFTPDSRFMLVYTRIGVQVRDTHTGEVIGPLVKGDGIDGTNQLCPDGTRVVVADGDGTMALCDTRDGKHVKGLIPVTAVEPQVFGPDGHFLLSTSGADVTLYDSHTGDFVSRLRGNASKLSKVRFSSNGQLLLTASNDWTVQVWDVRTRTRVGIPMHQDRVILDAVFSPDGKEILTISGTDDDSRGGESREHQATLWDVGTCQLVGTPMPCGDALSPPDFVFSFDSRMVLTVDAEGVGRIWDAHSGRLMSVVRDPIRSGVGEASFLADGTSIYAKSEAMEPTRGVRSFVADIKDVDAPWEVIYVEREYERALVIESSGAATRSIARSDDSLSPSPDGKVAVIRAGKTVATLVGHGPIVRSAGFSPDGSRIVTAGDDQTIRFWDAKTYRELVVFRTGKPIQRVQFTPDEARMIIDFADESMEIWDARDYDSRQKDRDARFNERPAAREYVAKLLAGNATNQPSDSKKLIRDDPNMTPLRKLVALEILDLEIRKREREVQQKAATTQPRTGAEK